MKHPVRCIAHGKLYGSLYEAKMNGIKDVLPIDKTMIVLFDKREDLYSAVDYLIFHYNEFIDRTCSSKYMLEGGTVEERIDEIAWKNGCYTGFHVGKFNGLKWEIRASKLMEIMKI